eukprot:3479308-Karenia_brevis.AAC.1
MIPVCPPHKWAAAVALKVKGKVMVSQNLATSHGWQGIGYQLGKSGAAVAHLARVYVKLPVL